MPDQLFKPHEEDELDKALADLVKRVSMLRAGGYTTGVPAQEEGRSSFLNRPNFFDPEVGPPDITHMPRAMRDAQKPGEEVMIPRSAVPGADWTPETPPEMQKETIGPAKKWQKPYSYERANEAVNPPSFLQETFVDIPQEIGVSAGRAVKGLGKQAAGLAIWPASVIGKIGYEAGNLILHGESPAKAGRRFDEWFEKNINKHFEETTKEGKFAQAPLEYFFSAFSTGLDKAAEYTAKGILAPMKNVSPQLEADVKEVLNMAMQGFMVANMGGHTLDRINKARVNNKLAPILRPTPIQRESIAKAKAIAKRVAKGERFDVLDELKKAGFETDKLIKNREQIMSDLKAERARYPEAFPEEPATEVASPGRAIEMPSVSVNVGGKTIEVVPEYTGATTIKVTPEGTAAAPTPAPAAPAPAAQGTLKGSLLKKAGLKEKPAAEVKTEVPAKGGAEPSTMSDPTTGVKRRVAFREGDSHGVDNLIKIVPENFLDAYDKKLFSADGMMDDGSVRHALSVEFKTVEEFVDFAARHELAHGLPEFSIDKFGGKVGPLEDAINKAVIEGLRPEMTDKLVAFFNSEIDLYRNKKWKPNRGFVSNKEADKFYEEEKLEGFEPEEWETEETTTVAAAKGEKGKAVAVKTEKPAPSAAKPARQQITEFVASERVKFKELLDQGKITQEGYDALLAKLDEMEKIGDKFPGPTKPAAPATTEATETTVVKPTTGGGQVIIKRGKIRREDLRANRNTIYLFGDNLEGKGLRGQAKDMRGEPNAIGVPTKKSPSAGDASFFTDKEFEQNKAAIDAAFAKIPEGKDVVIPAAGLGAGLAQLKVRAPKTWEYLEQKVADLKKQRGEWKPGKSKAVEATVVKGKEKAAAQVKVVDEEAALDEAMAKEGEGLEGFEPSEWEVTETAVVTKNHPMYYKMSASESNTGRNTTTLAEAEAGRRTSTTRGNPLGNPGDVVTFENRPQKYQITGIHQITAEDMADPAFLADLSRTEGWTIDAIKTRHAGQIKPGAWVTRYQKVGAETPGKAPGRAVEPRTQAPPTPAKAPAKAPVDIAKNFEDLEEMAWIDWKDDKDPTLRKIAEDVEKKQREIDSITMARPAPEAMFKYETEKGVEGYKETYINKAGEVDVRDRKRWESLPAATAPLTDSQKARITKLDADISDLMNRGIQQEKKVYGVVRKSVYPGAKVKEGSWLTPEEMDRISRESRSQGTPNEVYARDLESRYEGAKMPWPNEEVPRVARPAGSRITPGKAILIPETAPQSSLDLAGRFFTKIDAQGGDALTAPDRYRITGPELNALVDVFGDNSKGLRRILARQHKEGRWGEFTDEEGRAFTREYDKLREAFGRREEARIETRTEVAESPEAGTQFTNEREAVPEEIAGAKETRHKEARARRIVDRAQDDQFGDALLWELEPLIEQKALDRLLKDKPGLSVPEATALKKEYTNKVYEIFNKRAKEGRLPGLEEAKRYAKAVEDGKLSREQFKEWLDKESVLADNMRGYTWAAAKGGTKVLRYGGETTLNADEMAARRLMNQFGIRMPVTPEDVGVGGKEYLRRKFALINNEVKEAATDVFWGEVRDRLPDGTFVRRGGMVDKYIKDAAAKRRDGMDFILAERREILERYAENPNASMIAADMQIPESTVRDALVKFKDYFSQHVDEFLTEAESRARAKYPEAVEKVRPTLEPETTIPTFESIFAKELGLVRRISKSLSGELKDKIDLALEDQATARREAARQAFRDKRAKDLGYKTEEEYMADRAERGIKERPGEEVADEANVLEDFIPEEWETSGEEMGGLGDMGIDELGLGRAVRQKLDDYAKGLLRTPQERAAVRAKEAGVWQPESVTAREKMQVGYAGQGKKTLLDKMKIFADDLNRGFMRYFGYLDKKNPVDAPLIAHLVHHRSNIFNGRQFAERAVNGEILKVIDSVPGRKNRIRLHRTYNDYVWLRDLKSQAEARMKDGLPFDDPYFGSPEEVLKEWDSLNKYINDLPQFERDAFNAAINARETVFNALRAEIIEEGKKAGIENIEDLFSNPDYFRRNVIEHYKNMTLAGSADKSLAVRGPKSWARQRLERGHTKPWDIDVARVDADILSRLFYDKETLKLHNFVKENYDIWPEFESQMQASGLDRNTFIKKLDKEGWVSPDGTKFVAFWPERSNFVYTAKTMSERFARDFANGNLEEMVKDKGLETLWGRLKSSMNEALVVGMRKDPWMIPENIAKGLGEFSKQTPRSTAGTIMGAAPIQAWKKWTLFGPLRYAKYSFRNLTGDLEAAVVANPASIKRIFGKNGVAKNLLHYFNGDIRNMDPILKDYMDTWGYGNSFHRTEFSHLQRIANLDKAFSKIPTAAGWPLEAGRKVWKSWMSFAERTADLREGLLRAANYLEYYDQLSRNFERTGKMVPDNYGASNRKFIDGLQTIKEKAYHLSNDVAGAYDMISPIGTKLRSGAIPFWSWKEITMKRYYNMIKNAALDTKSATTLGKSFAKSAPFMAARIGKFAFKANLLMSAVQLANQLIDPRGEANLPQDVKDKPHLNLGGGHYFPGIGMASDLLDFFGMAAPPQMVWDLAKGNLTMDQIANRWVKDKPWINHMFQSINPFAKLGMELATRRKLYPNLYNPRGIRDPYEHVANAFQFGDVYRTAFDRPGKQNDYKKFIASLFDYQHDPYETAYFDWLKRVNDYKKTKGAQTVGYSITDKSNNLYWFKRARLEGDNESAQKFFKRWLVASFQEGGLRGKSPNEVASGITQSLKQSYRVMNPLYHLTPYEVAELGSQLTPNEKRMVAMAMGYWAHVIVGNEDASSIMNEIADDKEE